MALEMKPNCETCEAPLPWGVDACICSFECTFCPVCTAQKHAHQCPNCGGELVQRPKRNEAEA